jgi:flagellar L-ring protein precursor FlgH
MTRTLLSFFARSCFAAAFLVPALPVLAESLYSASTYRSLAADGKAFRPGDVITVQVIENSSAVSTADTKTQRKNGLDANFRLRPPAQEWGAGLSVGGDFAGGGATQRANRLLATLTVSVVEILPNGDLLVGGEQLLTVNDETHKVSVEGRVRPRDVAADNTVLSTRLADARIEYVGSGELAGRQRPSWWRRFVDWLGF